MNAQVREEAAIWFIEFRTEEADAATRERFADWLRASPAHVTAYLKLASVWEDAADLPPQTDLDALIRLAWEEEEGNVIHLEPRGPSGPHSAAAIVSPAAAPEIVPLAAQAAIPRRDTAENRGREPRGPSTLHETAEIVPSSVPLIGTLGPPTTILAKSFRRRRYAYAAAAAIAALTTTATWFALTRDPVYSTQLGEQRTLELADGSTVELNARSKLRVSFRTNERQVTLLEGQALFDVVHNASRPFAVVSGETRVEDVGTQFAVARNATSTVVTVIEGKVAVLLDNARSSPMGRHTADNAAAAGAGSSGPEQFGPSGPLQAAILVSAGEQVSVASGAVSQPRRANRPDLSILGR